MLRILVLALVTVLSAAAAALGASDLRIALPDGLEPEGIDAGPGNTLYVGSIATGAVLELDPETGTTETVVPGGEMESAIGIEVDGKNIVVAGGETGKVSVYDRSTGELRGSDDNNDDDTFVNDIARLGDSYYVSDSRKPVLIRVKRDATKFTEILLTGIPDDGAINLNGIEAGRGHLVAVHSFLGRLYRINPDTGKTKQIKVGKKLRNGDGLLLEGRTLYVVQNSNNKISVVRLSKDFKRGKVKRTITSPDFDVPTTLTRQDGDLYVVNARFGTKDPEPAPYWVTRLR